MDIRRATLDDLPRLVAMGERFLAAVYVGRIGPVDPAQMATTAAWMLADENRAVFVADVAGHLTGMIGVFLHPHPFTGEQTASEMFWWMEPETRGQGIRLLHAAESWARAAGAVVLQMVAPGADVARLYEHLGFYKVETSYARRLSAC